MASLTKDLGEFLKLPPFPNRIRRMFLKLKAWRFPTSEDPFQ